MRIDLTAEEESLVSQIEFDGGKINGPEQAAKNGQLVASLMALLLDRKAIPKQRLKYFNDMHFDQFKKNGHDADSTMRHGHFLWHLRYFLFGANLPAQIIAEFAKAVKDCGEYVSSGDMGDLTKRARALFRQSGMERTSTATEFYKLAIDLGVDPTDADSVRKAVLATR